jgi:hypothetical protein
MPGIVIPKVAKEEMLGLNEDTDEVNGVIDYEGKG